MERGEHPRADNGQFGSSGGGSKQSENDKPTGKTINEKGEVTLDSRERKRYNKALIGVKTKEGQEVKSIWGHVFDRAAQRDISPGDIKDCIQNATITYPGNTSDARTVYQKGILKIVISDTTEQMVSVMWRDEA